MLPLHCVTLWRKVDDSLSSLHWLQVISAPGANSRGPQPGGGLGWEALSVPNRQPLGLSVVALSPLAGDIASMGIPLTPVMPTPACSQTQQSLPGVVTHSTCPGVVGYNTNAHEKPHYSCATLIFMAIQASEKRKLRLTSIYEWFRENFSFYRCAKTNSWQSTIRHTLSVNERFIQLPKEKGESGKGRFWTVDAQHVERLSSGVYKVQFDPRSGSQQLPGHCEVTLTEQNVPSQGVGGRKRKLPQASVTNQAKVPCRSSSLLLRGDEQKELGSVEEHFNSDAVLELAESRELSPDSGEPLSRSSHTPPPVQHQLTELCSVASSAVSVPLPPPSCDLDCLPQSQFTIPILEDLVAVYDWEAFLDPALSEDLSQNSGEPLGPTPAEEDQVIDFYMKSFFSSVFGEEVSLDSGDLP